MKEEKKTLGISVKKYEDMSEWYTQVIQKAELADYSPVKGCMVIRPHGYAIWEKIQGFLDSNIKKMGVKNAYFPLFIPESFFQKEAEHAEGFAPEVAWIANKEESEERLAVRPTSETIMYDMYSRWIRSHRDLPLRINQWCNVVRWETKATKLFLRTREFLWQEGHCVYADGDGCEKETLEYLEEYRKVLEELLLIPVIPGMKTENEKFAGALRTYTLEALMPDGKALQSATSHNLGQGFARSFGIEFVGKDEAKHHPWQNSWGLSTRTIGGLVMVHGDDKGLVLPPKVAPIQIVIVPIIFDDSKEQVISECRKLLDHLKDYLVHLDDREEQSSGWKFNEWEMKGVPLRIEIGPKDLAKGEAVLVRRDTGDKRYVRLEDIKNEVPAIMKCIETDMFIRAKKSLDENTVSADNPEAFRKAIENRKMVKVQFCNSGECEDKIKAETGASSRCIPLKGNDARGSCFMCKRPSTTSIYFAKSY